MSNVDVEVYFSQFKEFFKTNPEELTKIIGKGSADDFFNEVYTAVNQNYENGNGVELTRKQIIDIIIKINIMVPDVKVPMQIFQNTKFGEICLN